MTIRFKIAAAALGLVLATGLASAQTGTPSQTAPMATQTTGVKAVSPTVPAKTTTAKVAHKTHRVHVSHRKVKHTKIVRLSQRAKLAHKAGLTHVVKAPLARKHVAKSHGFGTRKHLASLKTTIVR